LLRAHMRQRHPLTAFLLYLAGRAATLARRMTRSR
jgi:hypothetical protein